MCAKEVSKEQEKLFRDFEKLLQQNMDKALDGQPVDASAMLSLIDGIRIIRHIQDMQYGRMVY